MHNLQLDIRAAVACLKDNNKSIEVKSSCELFQAYVTRTWADLQVSYILYFTFNNLFLSTLVHILSPLSSICNFPKLVSLFRDSDFCYFLSLNRFGLIFKLGFRFVEK